jgi:hypothetical protein
MSNKKKRDPLFGGSWFAYLLLTLLALAAAQSVFGMFQPAPVAPTDGWVPTHMAPTATAQAEALETFSENYPDYTPAPTWSPPDNLPAVTPIPANAVLVFLPAPQWSCECISGVCEWAEVPVVGMYAYGVPDVNGTIDMRNYLVGTPGARPEGACRP